MPFNTNNSMVLALTFKTSFSTLFFHLLLCFRPFVKMLFSTALVVKWPYQNSSIFPVPHHAMQHHKALNTTGPFFPAKTMFLSAPQLCSNALYMCLKLLMNIGKSQLYSCLKVMLLSSCVFLGKVLGKALQIKVSTSVWGIPRHPYWGECEHCHLPKGLLFK